MNYAKLMERALQAGFAAEVAYYTDLAEQRKKLIQQIKQEESDDNEQHEPS